MITTMTRNVPMERTLTDAPKTWTVSRENSEENWRLL